MLDKIKSIKNNLRIGDKLEELRIKEMSAQITGFFQENLRFYLQIFRLGGKKLQPERHFRKSGFGFGICHRHFCH